MTKTNKRVCRDSTVLLGGVDVSNRVVKWVLIGEVGDLYMCHLTLIDAPLLLTITPDPELSTRLRVARSDDVVVGGVNISAWITGYRRIVHVGEIDTVELHVQCDRDVLAINGGYPWEEENNA